MNTQHHHCLSILYTWPRLLCLSAPWDNAKKTSGLSISTGKPLSKNSSFVPFTKTTWLLSNFYAIHVTVATTNNYFLSRVRLVSSSYLSLFQRSNWSASTIASHGDSFVLIVHRFISFHSCTIDAHILALVHKHTCSAQQIISIIHKGILNGSTWK